MTDENDGIQEMVELHIQARTRGWNAGSTSFALITWAGRAVVYAARGPGSGLSGGVVEMRKRGDARPISGVERSAGPVGTSDGRSKVPGNSCGSDRG